MLRSLFFEICNIKKGVLEKAENIIERKPNEHRERRIQQLCILQFAIISRFVISIYITFCDMSRGN